MPRVTIAVVTCLLIECCVASTTIAAPFSARFSWKGVPACSTISPAFSVSSAPSGTTALTFVMHDRDAPDFQHGGSTVPYTGQATVSRGAITYVGPCPPSGATHRYTWTIEALGPQGRALATTRSTGNFSR